MIQSVLAEELGAVLHLLLLVASLQSTNLTFPSGKRFLWCSLPSLWPRVILVSLHHSTLASLSVLLIALRTCVRKCEGLGPLLWILATNGVYPPSPCHGD